MKFSTWMNIMTFTGMVIAVAALLYFMAVLSGDDAWQQRTGFALFVVGMLAFNNFCSLLGVTEHDE